MSATGRHLAVDVRMAGDSGIGTYIQQLIPRITAARPGWRFTLLGREGALRELRWQELPNVEIRDCVTRIYTIGEQLELWRRCPRGVDLFWSPHYNMPLLHSGALVVTVHDVFHLAMREFVRGRAERAYARFMFGAVGRRADAILCVSQFTRGELRRHVRRVRVDPTVTPLGVDPVWNEGRRGERPHPRPYAVYVGNVKPHKNLTTLVRAFQQIAGDVPHDLVVIGRRDGMRTVDVAAQRAADALGPRIVFTGELPARLLRQYVAWADALVTPSLYEGFGLPPLEAMAAGCPTLVARAASLPEVCGDASSYCDPRDPVDMARQLKRLLLDASLQQRLRSQGRRHAAGYTWERCAARTLAVFEDVLARRSGRG